MDSDSNLLNLSIDSLFAAPKELPQLSESTKETTNPLNSSLDFPDLIELVPQTDHSTNNAFLFETPSSGNFNFFGEYDNLFQPTNNDEPWKLFSGESVNNFSYDLTFIKPEDAGSKNSSIKMEPNLTPIKLEEVKNEEIKEEEDSADSSTHTKKKQKKNANSLNGPRKSKKDLSAEELEEKKKQQLEKRLVKNRRTADISRKRKKARKATLEDTLKRLTTDSVQLERQSIELNAENRVLKSEYLALLTLIQNTPKLSKMFDKISNLAVSQPPEKLVMADTASAASVYLLNVIYSIHQTWNLLKNVNNNNNESVNPSLPNIAVN